AKKRGDAAWEDCAAFVFGYCPHHSNRQSRTGSDVVITRFSCPIRHCAIEGPGGKHHSFRLYCSLFRATYCPVWHSVEGIRIPFTCKKYISWKKYLPSMSGCRWMSGGRSGGRANKTSCCNPQKPLRRLF